MKTIIEGTDGKLSVEAKFEAGPVKYSVSIREGNDETIIYHAGNKEISLPFGFKIRIDPEESGGQIFIHSKDQWGSYMTFTHYDPSSLQSMFDFIARGFDIYNQLKENQ